MDKYTKWIIAAIILYIIGVSLMVYFAFFYGSSNDTTRLSPGENNTNDTIASTIIDDKTPKGFEIEPPETEKKDNIEKPGELPGKVDNDTNKSGYWIQQLPSSGTYSITPLVIYDKLEKGRGVLLFVGLLLVIVVYVIVKIAKRKLDNKNH
jgi:hypothetical protein